MEDWKRLNRAWWDERTPHHVASKFYDVPAFVAGRCSLAPFEPDEVGDVRGKSLVHLQCHFGLDTLSWGRRGARVTGLDFSQPAIDAAAELARTMPVAARFVCADVYEAAVVLKEQFDVVYTGHGALNWLPDLERWAATIARLLKVGGMLYLSEFHPIADAFADDELRFVHSYFSDEGGLVWEGAGSYADTQALTTHNRTLEFQHPLSSVCGALIHAGLEIDLFQERDFTLYQRWPCLEKQADGTYHFPPGQPRLPLLYALRAKKR